MSDTSYCLQISTVILRPLRSQQKNNDSVASEGSCSSLIAFMILLAPNHYTAPDYTGRCLIHSIVLVVNRLKQTLKNTHKLKGNIISTRQLQIGHFTNIGIAFSKKCFSKIIVVKFQKLIQNWLVLYYLYCSMHLYTFLRFLTHPKLGC